MKRNIFLTSFILLSLFNSCKEKTTNPESTAFDKGALLTNIGENLIVPFYNELENNIIDLETKYVQFSTSKSIADFDILKTTWEECYIQFNLGTTYEFGPAMDNNLRNSLGIFPVDTTVIKDNITSGSYNLGTVANIASVGFGALDYIFYRNDAYTDLTTNANSLQFGLDVIQKMKAEVTTVKNLWNTSYLTTFKASTGTSSTSGFSLFVNEFCKNYELSKNAKLGIPIGKQSLGIIRPEYLEARYSAISLKLLKRSVEGMHIIFMGNHSENGIGFDNYLVDLGKSDLSSSISSQFSDIALTIDNLNLTLEQEMNTNPAAVDALYTKMQNLVISLKTDMASAFGVLITYQDNDGD